MNPDLSTLEQAWLQHNWPVFTCGVILLLVWGLKQPFAGKVWEYVPKSYRPLVPIVLGLISGVAEALIKGTPWVTALALNIIAALSSIGTDQAVSKPLGSTTPYRQRGPSLNEDDGKGSAGGSAGGTST